MSSTIPVIAPTATPVVVPAARAAAWVAVSTLLALLAVYFVGVDQGMTSVFGNDVHVHELTHDARHLLGFPCH